MAYMRGDPYVYSTGETMEIRTARGQVSLPMEAFDALALMRHAQLLEDPVALATTLRAVAKRYAGNIGADALRRQLGLSTVINVTRTEDAT